MRNLSEIDHDVLSMADRYVLWSVAFKHDLNWREFYVSEKLNFMRYARRVAKK